MTTPHELGDEARRRLRDIGQHAHHQEEGLLVLSFVLDSRTWLHRRVDHVELLDAGWVRRTVSTDFTAPGAERTDPGYVPLGLVGKQISSFDVRDEQGVGVPVLTTGESAALSQAALRVLAEQCLHEGGIHSLPDSVLAAIDALSSQSQDEAMATLQASHEGATNGAEGEAWRCLLDDPLFQAVSRDFAQNRLLLAAVPLSRGSRRVMTFSYDEHLVESRESPLSTVAKAFAWRDDLLVIPIPGAALADSYRFELAVAGEDLEFGATAVRLEEDAAGPASTSQLRSNRVFLSLPDPDARYYVSAALGVARGGFLLSCLLFTAFIWVVLGAGLIRLDEIRSEVDAMTTLLGLLPPILAGLLVRQGEHGMATRLFAGLRLVLLLTTAAGLVAVLALIGDLDESALTAIWGTAFGVATLAFVALLCSNLLPRRSSELPANAFTST